ncbi:hypothetical protein [Bradyrhizobium sp. dw_411]|uniref:hypothetical protein n=1 Tax=Bradyrhizobium sp. dw_411 TaxID=2720082 RepID=UPI00201C95BE|nr:hypothetical protein [Bradyrhizobium sp. dw_411]
MITYLVAAAYVGEGAERWAPAHQQDVARLYWLVLEKGAVDRIYHAVGEEGVTDIKPE